MINLHYYINYIIYYTTPAPYNARPYNGRFFGNFRKLYIKNDPYIRNIL